MTEKPIYRRRSVVKDAKGKRQNGEPTPYPETITTGADRGQALRAFFDENHLSITGFAKAMGVSRTTLNTYLKGKPDLAYVPQNIAEGLITAMGIADTDAWTVLGIPDDAKPTFRTFRAPPWGHGLSTEKSHLQRIELLETQLVGEETLSHAIAIWIDPEGVDRNIQIVELDDGRYYSVSRALLQHAGGKHLGGLVQVDY